MVENSLIYFRENMMFIACMLQVPQHLDAIVIGSGIGGMSTAAILSKVCGLPGEQGTIKVDKALLLSLELVLPLGLALPVYRLGLALFSAPWDWLYPIGLALPLGIGTTP